MSHAATSTLCSDNKEIRSQLYVHSPCDISHPTSIRNHPTSSSHTEDDWGMGIDRRAHSNETECSPVALRVRVPAPGGGHAACMGYRARCKWRRCRCRCRPRSRLPSASLGQWALREALNMRREAHNRFAEAYNNSILIINTVCHGVRYW